MLESHTNNNLNLISLTQGFILFGRGNRWHTKCTRKILLTTPTLNDHTHNFCSYMLWSLTTSKSGHQEAPPPPLCMKQCHCKKASNLWLAATMQVLCYVNKNSNLYKTKAVQPYWPYCVHSINGGLCFDIYLISGWARWGGGGGQPTGQMWSMAVKCPVCTKEDPEVLSPPSPHPSPLPPLLSF